MGGGEELAFQIDHQIPWTKQDLVMNYAAGMLNEGLSPAMARCYLSQMKAMHITKGKPFPEARLAWRIINGRENKKEEGRKRMAVFQTRPRGGRGLMSWFYWNTEKNNSLKKFEGNYN